MVIWWEGGRERNVVIRRGEVADRQAEDGGLISNL